MNADKPDACGQPVATLALAALVGGVIGLAAVTAPVIGAVWRHLHP